MFRRLLIAFVAMTAIFAAPIGAAPKDKSGPTGTIALAEAPEAASAAAAGPQYGDHVSFDTTVNGKVDKHAQVYITVVCTQGSTVVYQWSAAVDFDFPLEDQAGQGLEWDTGDADCEASLIYRVEKGRNTTYMVLDATAFAVSGA